MTILWQKDLITTDDSGDLHAVNNAIVHDGIFWTHAQNATYNQNYLYGYDVKDGRLVKNIHITALNSTTWPVREIAVDQNGYIWVKGAVSKSAFYVINPSTETIVQSLFTMSSNIWEHNVLRFDPVNNLMWSIKDNRSSPQTATIVGVSTVNYTETVTINLMTPTYFFIGGMSVDTDKGELWVYYGNNTIRIYRCADGVLLHTLTSSFDGSTTYVQYVPEKQSTLVYDSNGDNYEIWSTISYTVTNTFSNSLDFPSKYNAVNNRMYGTALDPTTGNSTVAYFNWDDPTNTVLAEDLGFCGVLSCRKGVSDTGEVFAILYDCDLFEFDIVAYTFSGAREIILCTDEDTSSNNDEVTNYDAFNRELILDLTLGAFSIYDIAHTGDQLIRDYVDVPPFYLTRSEVQLYRGNDPVTDGSGNPVTISGYVSTVNRQTDNRRERFKFLITAGNKISLAEYKDYRFVDWFSIDGVGLPYNTYLLTGYELSQDMLRQKQSIYLKIFFERTEDVYTLDSDGNVVLAHQSGCKVQSHWNWNNSAAQGKWGIPFQGYRLLRTQPANPSAGDTFDYGERVIVTKNKLRGRGHCLSLLFVPECGKDTKLLGWALENTKNDFP